MYFDLTKIKKITNNNPTLIVEAIDYYLESIPSNLEQIKKASHSDDWEKIADLAHEMLSTISMLGMKSMKNPLQTIETYASEKKNLNKIPSLFNHIEKLYTDSYDELIHKKNQLLDKM